MGSVKNVLIENATIHHCLRSTVPNCGDPSCRKDAHGIAGASVRNLIVRDTEIHAFSGDGLQFDAGRTFPG